MRDGELSDDAIVGVFLEAGDEVDAFIGPVGEELVVIEGFVHGDDGSWVEVEEPGDFDFVLSGGGDVDEAGEIVVVIEEDVDLDAALGSSELGPLEEAEAEGDGGGVEGMERVFEAKLFSGAEAAAVVEVIEGCEEEVAEEFGGPMFVGVGEGRAGDGAKDAEVAELAEAALEAPGNLAERICRREMAEEHGDKLRPAGKALGASLRLMLLDEGGELRTREVMKDLTENTCNLYHKAVLLAVVEDGFSTIPSCHAKEDFSFSYFGH